MKVDKRSLGHIIYIAHANLTDASLQTFAPKEKIVEYAINLLTQKLIFGIIVIQMSATKAKGSSKNGRDSQSKRLGVKVYGGQTIKNGMIIVRQRGSKYYAGKDVQKAGDDTIFATKDGVVAFTRKTVKDFTGKKAEKVFVSVI